MSADIIPIRRWKCPHGSDTCGTPTGNQTILCCERCTAESVLDGLLNLGPVLMEYDGDFTPDPRFSKPGRDTE